MGAQKVQKIGFTALGDIDMVSFGKNKHPGLPFIPEFTYKAEIYKITIVCPEKIRKTGKQGFGSLERF